VPGLLIGAKGDQLFLRDEVVLAKSTIPRATYIEIESAWGHSACAGFDPEATKVMTREIAAFLARIR
jgi:homoserine acetyltransferase